MGEETRAELIEGIVYVWGVSGRPRRVSLEHGVPHFDLAAWCGRYCSRTPGLLCGNGPTVFLDVLNEPEPDVVLGIPVPAGGRTKLVAVNGKQYVHGAPDLLIEVAASSASIDLNAKLAAYERNGVGEYLVVLTEEPREVRWMSLVDTRFQPIRADADGLVKSALFPGLWLDPAALLAGDLPKLLAAVDQGCATDAHRAFVDRLVSASRT